MKVREVIKMLEEAGWRLDRQVGSHRQFRHPDKPGTVTVPGHEVFDFLGGGSGGGQAEQRPQAGDAGQRVPPSRPERTALMIGYAVVIEGEGDSFSGYAPDLPGCVHIESLRAHGEPVPEPSEVAATVVQVA
jgi:predicted RNase H-like HicB family nuclease